MAKLANGVDIKMHPISNTEVESGLFEAIYILLADNKPTDIVAFYRYSDPENALICELRSSHDKFDLRGTEEARNEWIEKRLWLHVPKQPVAA